MRRLRETEQPVAHSPIIITIAVTIAIATATATAIAITDATIPLIVRASLRVTQADVVVLQGVGCVYLIGCGEQRRPRT